jgi:hypothetical protein
MVVIMARARGLSPSESQTPAACAVHATCAPCPLFLTSHEDVSPDSCPCQWGPVATARTGVVAVPRWWHRDMPGADISSPPHSSLGSLAPGCALVVDLAPTTSDSGVHRSVTGTRYQSCSNSCPGPLVVSDLSNSVTFKLRRHAVV